MSNETEIINSFFDAIRKCGNIIFPNYQFPSIKNEELIKESSIIFFMDGSHYNKISKKLAFTNDERFIGEITGTDTTFNLGSGVYTWPSGQTFKGKFNDNLFVNGELKYGSYLYKGNFKNGLFEGNGEFYFDEKEYVKGNFDNGQINGIASVKKDNFLVCGNFLESKVNGKIDYFNINLENHKYEFKDFSFINERIEDEILEFKKDGNKFTYIKLLDKIHIEPNSTEIILGEKELSDLKEGLDLINIKIPEFSLPTIPEEGLKMKEDNYPIIKFVNGEEANIDDDNDENELIIPNGEKFKGILYLKNSSDSKICYMKEGKYVWPNGQEYEGKFNENNKFETTTEDSKLNFNNEWDYKGKFKDGQFCDKGKITWKDGKTLEGYFKNNRVMGHIKINFKNISIEANMKDSLISGIKIVLDKNIYKIKKIDLNNKINEPILITKEIREDEFNHFFLNYRINKDRIIIEKINKLPKKELENVLNILDRKIEFPSFELPSIKENSLIREEETRISFNKGIYYDIEKETLFIPNKEYLKGKLENSSDNYFISNGEYYWPSGQKYIGKFNEDHNFHSQNEKSTLITELFTYVGEFEDGLPNGDGEIKWKNGDIIKGKFIKGKIFDNAYVKSNNISFEGKYTSSILNGFIKNIKISNSDKQIENQLTIVEGKIQEEKLKFGDNEIEITNENRLILNENNYKSLLFDEDNALFLFKFICKIRKLSLPIYEHPRISEDGIYIQFSDKLQKVKLAFPNEEIFTGEIMKISGNKYMLTEGEYTWPHGQKYKGKFEKNRFNDDKGELFYPDQSKYIGGFKDGLFDGYGKFTNKKNAIFEGLFKEGQIKKNIKIKTQSFLFEGDNIDFINELYIKLFQIKTKEHNYEISNFNINNSYLSFKKDGIEYKFEMKKEIKQEIIESLLIRNKISNKKFYYNNPYMGDLSNENMLKSLKIEDNIYSRKLSKITIYKNRLINENKNKKKEVRTIGSNLSKKMSLPEIEYRLNSVKQLKAKINHNIKSKQPTLPINFGQIEKKEIARIFNRKMLKEMEKENDLLKQDISTLKMEKELIEKDRYNRIKEMQDLNLYFELIDNNYNDLIKEKNKKDEETVKIQNELNQIYKDNDLLNKYFKKKPEMNTNEELNKTIKEFEYNNNIILNEINEKEQIINEQNKEKDELLKQIEEIEKQNKK